MEEEEAQPPLPHCCLRKLRKFLSQVFFSVLFRGVILQCCGKVGKARRQAPLPLSPAACLARSCSEGAQAKVDSELTGFTDSRMEMLF